MMRVGKPTQLLVLTATLAVAACTPTRYRSEPIEVAFRRPAGTAAVEPGSAAATGGTATAEPPDVGATAAAAATADAPLPLSDVIASVTLRYPPYLSTLLDRDLASGRLTQAMGNFDTNLSAKVGDGLQGFYEPTIAQGLVEQPLATGDTIYGGYRWSDGFQPDYDKDRTQAGGEIVFGARVPLLLGRDIDKRRAAVRQAEIGVELAEPRIQQARIAFVQAASKAYFGWVAAGRKLTVARELLQLATDRQAGMQRAVENEFLAPIELTDNERLITQRQVFVARAERSFQQAALLLSLYLRTPDDRPIVPGPARLPAADDAEPPALTRTPEQDLERAAAGRPEFRRLRLEIDDTKTALALAENDRLPKFDLVVEGSSSLSNGPYKDREDLELFVGGEIALPAQRRAAIGKMQQQTAKLGQLRLEQQFLQDRVLNEVLDARSAVRTARAQLTATERNIELAQQLVAAEQRSFELGLSDLLRIQLREAQLADARMMAIDARRGFDRAFVDYRAALGTEP